MKNKRQFIAGFLTCLILLSAIFITAFAEGISVLSNPFPILFNGQLVEIEAYNINGRTFLALGDIAKHFNASATLNETTKQIEINSITPTFSSNQNTIYKIGDTAITDKYEITLISIEYKDYPTSEIDEQIRYFNDSNINMALVKYKIKNITDHDVKTISFSSYEDQYAEKPVKGFSNILQHYAPEYCKINSIGYDSGYLNSGEEIIFTIDVPTKRSEPIKSIKIDNILFRL